MGCALGPPQDSPEALAARLHRLETAVDATGLGLWEWNVATGELTWNDSNARLFGVEPGPPGHVSAFEPLVHPEDRAAVREAYARAVDGGASDGFNIEYRTAFAPGGKTRWVQTRARILRDADGGLLVVGANLDITDRRVAEERRGLVLRELAHRAKNGILVMMAIVSQTARGAANIRDFETLLMSRLKAMADSQDLVTRAAAGAPLRLGDLLDQALTPFGPARFDRAEGVDILPLPNDVALGLALLLHELSTNAMKYGALSTPAGRIALALDAGDGESGAVLTWTEQGGPPVGPVTRKGFGSRLLELGLRAVGGGVEAEFHPEGFRARIRFPAAPLERPHYA